MCLYPTVIQDPMKHKEKRPSEKSISAPVPSSLRFVLGPMAAPVFALKPILPPTPKGPLPKKPTNSAQVASTPTPIPPKPASATIKK